MSLGRSRYTIFPRFSIEEYEKNPAAIKKVYDAALEYIETLNDTLEKKDTLLKKKDEEISAGKNITTVDLAQPFFLLIGSAMFAYGVNITTASPHSLAGWALTFSGCTVQLLAIFIGLLVKLRRRN